MHVKLGGFPGIIWDENEPQEDHNGDQNAPLNVGYRVVNMMVNTFENNYTIMKSLPTGDLEPQPFIEGSRALLEKVAEKVRMKHGLDFPGAVAQWTSFLESAPQNDDAEDFCRINPLYVPFKERLFGILPGDARYAETRDDCSASKEPQVINKTTIATLHHYAVM